MAGRSYYIRHRKSGKYIDVKDASNKDGAAVQQYEFSGSSEQKWHIEDAGEGYIIFKAFDGNGTYVLDIGTDANGAKAKLAAYANKDSQKFRIKPVGEGMYLITSKISKDKKRLIFREHSLIIRFSYRFGISQKHIRISSGILSLLHMNERVTSRFPAGFI